MYSKWNVVPDSPWPPNSKIYSIELSVTIDPKKRIGVNPPHCNGWALISYVSFESTQKALFAHLTRRIPGMCTPISIYKGCCSNVVLLKNLPSFLSKADILSRINSYQGLVSISFIGVTTARMVFEDLDYYLDYYYYTLYYLWTWYLLVGSSLKVTHVPLSQKTGMKLMILRLHLRLNV
ncbi:unnamed protein product [Orchesella dallaii]|uniref:Uncharacterized protein n=1 Tax=Orchesella dallaii TaxID=48710 RepID=A0ABP1SA58_9HEXA